MGNGGLNDTLTSVFSRLQGRSRPCLQDPAHFGAAKVRSRCSVNDALRSAAPPWRDGRILPPPAGSVSSNLKSQRSTLNTRRSVFGVFWYVIYDARSRKVLNSLTH